MKIPRKRLYGATPRWILAKTRGDKPRGQVLGPGLPLTQEIVPEITGRGYGEAGRCWRMSLIAVGEFSSASYTVIEWHTDGNGAPKKPGCQKGKVELDEPTT